MLSLTVCYWEKYVGGGGETAGFDFSFWKICNTMAQWTQQRTGKDLKIYLIRRVTFRGKGIGVPLHDMTAYRGEEL
jgi:hypothetical protein